MNEESTFNLDNIVDLPEEVIAELRFFHLHPATRNIINLFKVKKHLSVNEVLVGLFRKYRLIRTQRWVHTAFYRMKNKKIIKNVTGKTGYFELEEFYEQI